MCIKSVLDFGDDATIIDAMDWMHTHQLSSKNLTAGEKLAMTMELQKEIALENKKKKLSTLKQNASNRSLQLECRIQIIIEFIVTLGRIRKQQKKQVSVWELLQDIIVL